jgi:hypothetical protein
MNEIPALLAIDLPVSGVAALAGGLVVFAVITAMMYVIFRMLKKSIKMAFRLAIVIAVFVIAAVGGLSLWWFSSGNSAPDRPSPSRKK